MSISDVLCYDQKYGRVFWGACLLLAQIRQACRAIVRRPAFAGDERYALLTPWAENAVG